MDEGGLRRVAESLASFSVEVNLHVVDLSSRANIIELWDKLSGERA